MAGNALVEPNSGLFVFSARRPSRSSRRSSVSACGTWWDMVEQGGVRQRSSLRPCLPVPPYRGGRKRDRVAGLGAVPVRDRDRVVENDRAFTHPHRLAARTYPDTEILSLVAGSESFRELAGLRKSGRARGPPGGELVFVRTSVRVGLTRTSVRSERTFAWAPAAGLPSRAPAGAGAPC